MENASVGCWEAGSQPGQNGALAERRSSAFTPGRRDWNRNAVGMVGCERENQFEPSSGYPKRLLISDTRVETVTGFQRDALAKKNDLDDSH